MASATKITDILVRHGNKEFTFKVHEAEKGDGYWARCNEVPAAITQGETLDELAKNMKEALTLALRPIPSKMRKKVEPEKP